MYRLVRAGDARFLFNNVVVDYFLRVRLVGGRFFAYSFRKRKYGAGNVGGGRRGGRTPSADDRRSIGGLREGEGEFACFPETGKRERESE